MSKLDDAINEAVKPKLKQNVKDLFIELVGEEETLGARLPGLPKSYRDDFRDELRKKIEEL